MSKRKMLEKKLSALWTGFNGNPATLAAISEIQSMRERNKDWLFEDELPDGYDWEGNFDKSEIRDGVRMFPR